MVFYEHSCGKKYGFTGDECWAEMCWRLFEEILRDKTFAKNKYLEFQELLATKGVTAIKEIGFDDYYGFAPVLKELENEKKVEASCEFSITTSKSECRFCLWKNVQSNV